MSDYVQLSDDYRARVRHRESDGQVVLDVEERGDEGLGGYHWHQSQIKGRDALEALSQLLRSELDKAPA